MTAFRNYESPARPSVKELYRLNHESETLDFVKAKEKEYLPPRRKEMGVWEAIEWFDSIIDDSDPDTDLSQIEHALQTAEAIRADGHPRWFVVTGFITRLGIYEESCGLESVTCRGATTSTCTTS